MRSTNAAMHSLQHPSGPTVIHYPVTFFTDDASHQDPLTDMELTLNIMGAIKELRSTSAAGTDGVSAILLLKCGEALAHPTGIVPTLLRKAMVCSVYKGGE